MSLHIKKIPLPCDKNPPRQGRLLLHRTSPADLGPGVQFHNGQGTVIGENERHFFPQGILDGRSPNECQARL